MTEQRQPIFREEAVRHASALPSSGGVLRLSAPWTRWSYWLPVTAFIVSLTYCAFGTVYEFAGGPAIVWVTGRSPVTATTGGIVASVHALPGQQVQAGDLLVRFYSAREEAEIESLDRESDLHLLKSLQDPSDQASRQALTTLRTQRESALARLDQLAVHAPREGVIGDVRIRPGQALAAGDIVVTLSSSDANCTVLAMLPAQHRPRLRRGQSMRFELDGYRYAYLETTIEAVGAQIIGPHEVQRYLGQEIDDAVKVDGPVVLVEARPPSCSFAIDDQALEMHHGMLGTGEARVRSETILLSAFPGLRVVLQRLGG